MNNVLPATHASQKGPEALASTGLRARLRRAGNGLWRLLEAHGQARARQHMLQLALNCEHTQPELAEVLRQASR